MRDTRPRPHAGQDWREAWYSEADAGRAQPWASDLERQPLDEIAALEQFPSELAEVPAPASGLPSGPRHDRPPALARHPRTLVAAGGVGTLLLSFFVMGLRPEPERSFPRDVYLPDLRVEAAAAEAAADSDSVTVSRRSALPARSAPSRNAASSSPRGAARQPARGTSDARAEGRSASGAMRAPLAAPLPAGRTASAGRSTSPPIAPGRTTGASAPSLSAAGRTAGAGRSAPPIVEGIRLSQAVEPPARSFATSPATESDAVAAESAPDPSPVPAPTPAGPSAASPPAPPPTTDRQVINGVLEQYRAALNRLDAGAMKAVWPALDAGAAARAFSQLERQAVSFNGCSIAIYGDDATARCQGRASYVPRVGPRDERVADRQWRIELRKADGDWRIVEVEAR